MRAARTDPHTQRIQLRHIIPLWSRRHRNAVPLKIRIFLHTPRIGLVGSVFAEFHWTKGNHTLIKHSTVHTLPLIQLLQLSRKFHSLIHLVIRQSRTCPAGIENRRIVGGKRILPAIAVNTKGIQGTVMIRIQGHLFTDCIEIIPCPVIIRQGDTELVQQRLIHIHHGWNTFIWQGILLSIHLSAFQCRCKIVFHCKLFIALYVGVQLLQHSDIRKGIQIVRQYHVYIRQITFQSLLRKPFGVVRLLQTAHIFHPHIRMCLFKAFNGLIDNFIAVSVGNIPVASGKHAEFQDYCFLLHIGKPSDSADTQQQQHQSDQQTPFHPLSSCSAFSRCIYQMASCVRSRSSSLSRITLR